jgi:hypothetical protein
MMERNSFPSSDLLVVPLHIASFFEFSDPFAKPSQKVLAITQKRGID